MLEFIEVASAPIFPHCCMVCRGTQGPLLDTHTETREGHRIYLCDLCIQRAARVRGYTEGKRMDELVAAAGKLDVVNRENDRLRADLEALRVRAHEHDRLLGQAREQLAGQTAQLDQWRSTAKETGAHLLDMAGIALDAQVGKVGR